MTVLQTTMTQKGQVTIPQALRQKLGLKAHDKVSFELVAEDAVILRPARRKIADFYRMACPIAPFSDVEEMVEHAIKQNAADVAREGLT